MLWIIKENSLFYCLIEISMYDVMVPVKYSQHKLNGWKFELRLMISSARDLLVYTRIFLYIE